MNLAHFIAGLNLAHPWALYLLALPALVMLWAIVNLRSVRAMPAPLMRALALALFILAMAAPQKVIRTRGTTRPVVLDASASITPAMRRWDLELLRKELKLRADDPAIIFASTAVNSTVGKAGAMLESAGGCVECDPKATDLANALGRLAADPAARGGPALLLTDGWQNLGDADNEVSALRSANVRLYIFTPPGPGYVPDVAMRELSVPPALSKAAPFQLGVTIENLNNAPVSGTLEVYQGGSLMERRKVKIAPGTERFDFTVKPQTVALQSYRALFKPDDPATDIYKENDSLEEWVGVGAHRKVLILTAEARDASYLATVARRMGLEPDVVSVTRGQWNGSLKGYDSVVLDNIERSRLSPAAQNALVSYVEQGGSLAMVGGDRSFGLGGYQASPIANVMPVTMKPPERKILTSALILIIDKSGSMGRNNKLTYAKAAAETVTQSLKPDDLLGVIGFDSQPFVIVPLQPVAKSKPYLDEMINRLRAQGRTFLLPALEQAERSLAQSTAAIKHVVILTDGETGGTADMYYALVSTMHHDLGISISAVAIGREANTALLQAIAKYGGGAYYQTDSPSNLPQIVLQDFNKQSGQTTMVEKEFIPLTTSPNPVLKDYAGRRLPALKGYVSTELRPGASLDAFVDRSGRREPIIASWKRGAGKVLAVTTDASGRWSGRWIADNVFAPVWNRLFAWMTPQTAEEQNVQVALGYEAGRIVMKLTDYSEKPGLGSHPVTATVTRPNGARSDIVLSDVAPGELSAAIQAPTPGTYYIEVRSSDPSREKFPPLAYTVSPAVNAELPRPTPNYSLLERLAAATGGRLNPSIKDVELTRPTIDHKVALDWYLVVAAMLMVIGEAAVRRLTI